MHREPVALDQIKVAAPCTAEWRFMLGNERVRFCGQCSQYVYNLSEMTREQVEDLVLRHEGRLCVRFYRRRDGTLLTSNCPVGLRALKAKYNTTKATIIKAVIAFLAYLGALGWFQSKPISSPIMGTMVAFDSSDVDAPVDPTGYVVGALPVPAPPLVKHSEKFIRAQAIYKVSPVAESSASRANAVDAVVRILISASGQVESASLVSGPEGIRDIAEAAARQWVFKPMTQNGRPVRVESTLTFHFGNIFADEANRLLPENQRVCRECL